MIKKIVKILSVIFLISVLLIYYLSTFGIKTSKFNNQIKNKILQVNKEINVDLKTVKIILSPFDFKAYIETLDTKILFNNKEIELESLKTEISLLDLLKNRFPIDNLKISSKSIKAKNLVSLIRSLKNEPKLLFLEIIIKDGYVKASLDLNFDKIGKIKNDYKINGFVKKLKFRTVKKYNLENLNFIFDIENKKYKFSEIETQFNKIRLNSDSILVEENNNNFLIAGKFSLNDKENISINIIEGLVDNYSINENLKDLKFSSKNNFSFNLSKNYKLSKIVINSEINLSKLTYKNKFEAIQKYFPEIKESINLKDHKIKFNYNKDRTKISGTGKILIENNEDRVSYEITKKNENKVFKFSDLDINSEINLSKLTYKNKFEAIQKYFPEIKESINLKDHKIKFNYNKDRTKISGTGKILIENNEDRVSYEITKKNDKYYFKSLFEIEQNIFFLNELKYKKEKGKKISIKIDGIHKYNENIFFDEISLLENDNSIFIKDLNLDNELKVSDIGVLEFDYKNYDKIYNKISLNKDKNGYTIAGDSFDASKIINEIIIGKDDNTSIYSNLSSKIKIKINKTYIDKINFINNLSGNIKYKNNKINNLKLEADFPNDKKINLSIKVTDEMETITKLFSSHPKPLIKRYKFIKGFEGGILEFSSIKKNGVSNSLLIIDNFKIKEVPVFAKLLSLASLKGIADLLTGEGIRFTSFEMSFSNKKGLTTIEEMYAIGPAVSILMDGYIETKTLVSLRGTLVPATTINRSIGSIPILGKILIGNETGDGIFGVSFKIKGPPKKLKTTVNPIKSLTPRFITRTLEKIKKN